MDSEISSSPGFRQSCQPVWKWCGRVALVGFPDKDVFCFGDAGTNQPSHFPGGKWFLRGDEEGF